MAVAPNRLDGVAADVGDARELKRLWRQRPVRILIDIPQDVAFAFAACARASTPQRFQPHKAFAPIIPLDGQFIADLLNIRRSHEHSVIDSQPLRPPPRSSGTSGWRLAEKFWFILKTALHFNKSQRRERRWRHLDWYGATSLCG